MPNFFTAAHIKLSVALALLGALVALIFTIYSQSGAVALIFRPLVAGLLMFLLGSILYALLEKKVPEALEAIEANPPEMPESPIAEEGDADAAAFEHTDAESNALDADHRESVASMDMNETNVSKMSIPRKTGTQITKDEITVNGVTFKNQPEVMAEAVKQLMDQDKA